MDPVLVAGVTFRDLLYVLAGLVVVYVVLLIIGRLR